MEPKCAKEWGNQRNGRGQIVWFDFLSYKSTFSLLFLNFILPRSQSKIGRNYKFRFMILSSSFVLVKSKLLIRLEIY